MTNERKKHYQNFLEGFLTELSEFIQEETNEDNKELLKMAIQQTQELLQSIEHLKTEE